MTMKVKLVKNVLGWKVTIVMMMKVKLVKNVLGWKVAVADVQVTDHSLASWAD